LTDRFDWFIANIGEWLRDGDRVLDVLGGYGHFGVGVRKRLSTDFRYTVLDKFFIRTDGGQWKFDVKIGEDANNPWIYLDNVFDRVWMFGWYSENTDMEHIMSEIYRVLKNGGTLMMYAPPKSETRYNPNHLGLVRTYTTETLEKLLSEFQTIKIGVYQRTDRMQVHNYFGVVATKHDG